MLCVYAASNHVRQHNIRKINSFSSCNHTCNTHINCTNRCVPENMTKLIAFSPKVNIAQVLIIFSLMLSLQYSILKWYCVVIYVIKMFNYIDDALKGSLVYHIDLPLFYAIIIFASLLTPAIPEYSLQIVFLSLTTMLSYRVVHQ